MYYFIFFAVGAREVYERAVEFFGEENADEKLFLAFGKFEENCKEVSLRCCCLKLKIATSGLLICSLNLYSD